MPESEPRAARRARTRKPRGRGLRTRTGCVTCRKRHLKCDEGTPSCGPCMRSGHTCVYGDRTTSQAQSQGQPPTGSEEHATPLSSGETCVAATSSAAAPRAHVTEPDTALASAAVGDSPGSTVSSSRPAIGTAAAGWFGMLLDDTALDFGTDSGTAFYPFDTDGFDQNASYTIQNLLMQSPAQASSVVEHSLWQCSERIPLSTNEFLLFENFVRRISRWLDLFDPEDNFSTLVPRLAMYNIGLMNAVHALSVRHISLNPDVAPGTFHERADALKYYYETLHYLHKAMQFDSFKTSSELLATSLIVSTYEMLDGSSQDWERHLKGVFWIQRSRVIHGDSGGLKQAIWWTWLCQDVWAAFRERRKVFTFWKHPRSFDQLDEPELACRAIYTFSKAVNYCSNEDIEAGKNDVLGRITKAKSLIKMLDEWQSLLTAKFSPLPMDTSKPDVFTPIWIHPPSFAVAVQLHNAARILIYLHRPCLGGLNEHLQQQKEIKRCVDTICGIANTLIDDAASLLSSQCLYIAGLCVQDAKKRETILELIGACRHRTGWPIKPLRDELQALWNGT